MDVYRIHGDNIVECERIARIITNTLKPKTMKTSLVSPSVLAVELLANFLERPIEWRLELLPGFNKNTKKRWSGNIFNPLKEAGSFFDETPDAIISRIEGQNERILLGIEFCSALQAGNQAWQRSARAFSTGRSGCPYLYVVDFVKYELDNKTRKRKNLRFPNPVVPYSYVNYSKNTKNFVAQLYIKSEEFDRYRDSNIKDFDENDFGSDELGIYMVKRMPQMDTSQEESIILKKNMDVVKFLANHFNHRTNFTAQEWQEIYDCPDGDIVEYAVKKARFGFHKTIAEKSHHGKTKEFIKLAESLSIGLASRDLPFGIIPAHDRSVFAKKMEDLYKNADKNVIEALGCTDKHLIIAIFKGFKPRGDDNRPDRGILPLAAMLSDSDVDILTYVYGPMVEVNLRSFDENPMALARRNGLWCSILSLSNFVVLDVPVLSSKNYSEERVCNTSSIKNFFTNLGIGRNLAPMPAFSSVPVNFGEDDVDTGIHYLFTYILGAHCFEGMCNPPGGDWSGFSVIDRDYENRWLSLPRESDTISGKRPDHILELFNVFERPLLLSVESKEKSADLENDVGIKLITYINKLMGFVPSSKRRVYPDVQNWQWGDEKVCFGHFETMSAAAYLKKFAEPSSAVFKKKCEILFVMDPIMTRETTGWEIEIITSSKRSEILKDFIIGQYGLSGDKQFKFN